MLGSSSSSRLLFVSDFDIVFRLKSPFVGIRNMCLKLTSLLADAMIVVSVVRGFLAETCNVLVSSSSVDVGDLWSS
jgi:hypothetical protein